jgi:hypothetical protein
MLEHKANKDVKAVNDTSDDLFDFDSRNEDGVEHGVKIFLIDSKDESLRMCWNFSLC